MNRFFVFKRSASIFIKLLLLLGAIVILVSLLLPGTSHGLVKGATFQYASNYRQLWVLTQTASLDAKDAGKTNFGFPSDCGGTFAAWSNGLISNGYLSPATFQSMFSVKGEITNTIVFNVGTNDPTNTVFISTANLSAQGVGDKPPYLTKGGNGAFVTRDGSVHIVYGTNLSEVTNAIWPTSPPLK